MSKSREQLNQWLKEIDISEKMVLDVGVQDKPTSRLTKGIPAKYITIDIDNKWQPDIVADLNLPLFYNTDGCVWQCEQTDDIEVIGRHQINFGEGFDIVFCLEVLEHCWNPIDVISNLEKALKKDGRLYVSTPFINPHHDEWDFLRYTNEWYEKVLPMLGFEIIKIHERRATTGLAALQNFYTLEGMKYSKIRAQTKGPYTYPVGYFIAAKKR